MNMQNLMMQAKKMQKDIEKAQSELDSKIYEGKSQLITIKANGTGKLISVKIESDELTSDDKEILEDMFLVAMNNVMEQIEKDKEEKFGKYGPMFNGLM